ncbi:MAG: hypothetical protein RL196_313 [Actinomycetota bacterium]|jgi:hypothetical protein
MHILYLDESGDLGSYVATTSPNVQPIFVLGGISVPQKNIVELTTRLLAMKTKYFGLSTPDNERFELLRKEVKGKTLRSEFRRKGGHARLQLEFFDNLLGLLLELECVLIASIYVKAPGQPIDGRAVYTSAIQNQVRQFQSYLRARDSSGLVIVDARYKHLNSIVSHSVLTQMYTRHQKNNRLIESPVFGHSENHAGLQIADLVMSGLVIPIAFATYLGNQSSLVASHTYDHALKLRYASKLKKLQMVVTFDESRTYGFYVNDQIQGWGSNRLFVHSHS